MLFHPSLITMRLVMVSAVNPFCKPHIEILFRFLATGRILLPSALEADAEQYDEEYRECEDVVSKQHTVLYFLQI